MADATVDYRPEIEEIISDVRGLEDIKDKSKSILEKIASYEVKAAEEMKHYEETYVRRSLYAEFELLRLEYSELPIVDKLYSLHGRVRTAKQKDLQQLIADSELYKTTQHVMERFDNLRQIMAVRDLASSTVRRILTAFFMVTYIITLATMFIILCPIRFLHPLLRKAGLRTHQLPIDRFQQQFCRGMLFWTGVEVDWEGLDNIDPSKPYVSLYSHQSSYDAFVIGAGPLPLRLIGKHSLFLVPFLGWLGFLWGHIGLSRNNLTSAKKSLDLAVQELIRSERSTAISPEGTRSPTGRLLSFKPGPFHLAMNAKMDISPMLLLDAAPIYSARQWIGIPGRITVKILPTVKINPDDTYKTLKARVNRLYLEAYKQPIGKTRQLNTALIDFLSFPFAIVFNYLVFSFIKGLFF